MEQNACPLSKGKCPAASRCALILKPTKVVGQKKDFKTPGLKDPLVTLFPIAKCEIPQTCIAILVTEAAANAVICKY